MEAKQVLPRIYVSVTKGALENNFINVSSHLDFFPKDAIGAENAEDGEGKKLRLHFAGLADIVETDIPVDKKNFRVRGSVGEFFRLNQVKVGDEVVIEKLSKYEYKVFVRRD